MDYLKKTFTVPGPTVSQADWDRIFGKRRKAVTVVDAPPLSTRPGRAKPRAKAAAGSTPTETAQTDE